MRARRDAINNYHRDAQMSRSISVCVALRVLDTKTTIGGRTRREYTDDRETSVLFVARPVQPVVRVRARARPLIYVPNTSDLTNQFRLLEFATLLFARARLTRFDPFAVMSHTRAMQKTN